MSEFIAELINSSPTVKQLYEKEETIWINPNRRSAAEALAALPLSASDIADAEQRLARFAPFIRRVFPETEEQNGLIESPLTPIPDMQTLLNDRYHAEITGSVYLKRDSDLAVAGSVKARGGIYEILKHSEELALQAGLLSPGDSYVRFADEDLRDFFRGHSIHVGSTGNLGMSIGIISAVLGYRVTVHMSADAKQWKKDLLRSRGVAVMEYSSDYSKAVKEGRALAEQDPGSYFVDDENSCDLFLGYSVAAGRLAGQLEAQNIRVDAGHPLIVHIPCGVGGAPGGITFGLKHQFGDAVHCFFEEPVEAPCMVLGMASGLHDRICVQDIGLTGLTHADGLAVGRPSRFVGKAVDQLLSGIFTCQDAFLYDSMRELMETEKLFIEPSSCAAFKGLVRLHEAKAYLEENGLLNNEGCTHIVWATGGRLVPPEQKTVYFNTFAPSADGHDSRCAAV